jgi:hypothetical protein
MLMVMRKIMVDGYDYGDDDDGKWLMVDGYDDYYDDGLWL